LKVYIKMETNEEFDYNLERLYSHFHKKIDTMTLYTREVVRICSGALDASNIRHSPITFRIKSWESAKGTIARRNQERVLRGRLRDAVEAQGRRWEDYSHEFGLKLSDEEMEPFKTPEDMLAALHDFGGTRISLYFPGDIERVVSVIQARFNILRRIDKGHVSQTNMRGLEELLQSVEKPEARADSGGLQQPIRTFPGYKATHLHVKLRDEDIQELQKPSWNDVAVEVQVGSLVMHVWSEIEHDMIYKPLNSQGCRVSEDEERILDLINGIVLTGEAALRQLEASTANRLNQRAQYKGMAASSHYELATWIEKYCEEREITLEGAEWGLLEQLFSILKTTGDDKNYRVTELLDESASLPTSYRHSLPVKMLSALCKRPCSLAKQEFQEYGIIRMGHSARFWALRLVHSLNLAIYLGVAKEFLEVETLPRMPSISAFLDILHPEQPTFSSAQAADAIIACCRAIVDPDQRRGGICNDLVRVAMDLPVTNLVVTHDDACGPGTLLVPCILSRLFQINANDEPGKFLDMESLPSVIDFLDFYLSHRESENDNIVIWNRLTAKQVNREHECLTTYGFFVPNASRKYKSQGLWRLSDNISQLRLRKMSPDEIDKSADSIEWKEVDSSASSDGLLELMYRLYPEGRSDEMRKAIVMIAAYRTAYQNAPDSRAERGDITRIRSESIKVADSAYGTDRKEAEEES
jgi:ppGpp synthetase/RelA/SpoT-type nucleotidyltranferase